jgi:hypothetical protein
LIFFKKKINNRIPTLLRIQSNVIMEKITILRIFAWFPLIGMLGPDVVAMFTSKAYHIPTYHVVGEVALAALIGVLSLIILKYNRKQAADQISTVQ